MNGELWSLFAATFVTFFVLIDAVGVAPIFASLTAKGSPAYRRRMAIRATIVAAIIIYAFAFGGAWLLDAMHISIDAFRAAGGILLFLIALDMVFEKRTERRENRAEEVMAEHSGPEDDIAVFPVGIPMIAGPGTIATAMLYMSNSPTWLEQGVVLLSLGVNLLLCLVIFLAAGPLVRLLGDSVAGAVTRSWVSFWLPCRCNCSSTASRVPSVSSVAALSAETLFLSAHFRSCACGRWVLRSSREKTPTKSFSPKNFRLPAA